MSALGLITIAVAILAAAILIVYWTTQPALGIAWRILLFCAVAVLPTIAAGTSTTEAMATSSERKFCGSCHVMEAHYFDAIDPNSRSLASRHTRNDAFGESSCYECHANYGMYGYPLTKLNGLRHVWAYYFGQFRSMSLEEALPQLHTYEPYPNENCLHCHSGSGALFRTIPDHRASWEDVLNNEISCASTGCHGRPHPDVIPEDILGKAPNRSSSEERKKRVHTP